MELIDATEISPYVSKGVCKVCYVGQEPNRNGTVITKEVATEMGRKLPGSPVVGFFDEEKEDFDGHNRELIMKNGSMSIIDTTKPYGFVPTDTDVWFQKFADEGTEHDYLCCHVYLWTGIYPESQRVIAEGNNQSMELDQNSSGFWSKDVKTSKQIFIYNEALIKKLCILGSDVEPCFEGAQIKESFSLKDDSSFQQLQEAIADMQYQLTEIKSKGGSLEPMEQDKGIVVTTADEATEITFTADESGDGCANVPTAQVEDDISEESRKYNLEEIPEYVELRTRYEALKQEKENLDTEVTSLREFKQRVDRKEKQEMIDKFYMLTDEQKKDVVEHIDTYSLDEIEAKLSIICVRNRIGFTDTQEEPQNMFNLQAAIEEDNAPAWVKAVREHKKNI